MVMTAVSHTAGRGFESLPAHISESSTELIDLT